jgi:circadian clock protein KaiC
MIENESNIGENTYPNENPQINENIETRNYKQDGVLKTEIRGFDELFAGGGIPIGNSVLVAGGPGTGKSIFCRQICFNLVSKGKKCMYVSFEESKDRIVKSMDKFGWNVNRYIEDGSLLIQKINPLDILRMKFGSIGGSGSATELSYKIKPLVIPKEFHPDVIAVDSLSAIIEASVTKDKNYRIYLQQLFSFFEETGATSFLITETDPIPSRFSESGIEEFLADGIIVLYNFQKEDIRENAIEILKMRDGKHQKKIVMMEISDQGLVVHPEKRVLINSNQI